MRKLSHIAKCDNFAQSATTIPKVRQCHFADLQRNSQIHPRKACNSRKGPVTLKKEGVTVGKEGVMIKKERCINQKGWRNNQNGRRNNQTRREWLNNKEGVTNQKITDCP